MWAYILDKLRVPDDVRLYFEYRESVLPRLREAGVVVEEPDIMVAFLSDKDLPEPGSIKKLRTFVQDLAVSGSGHLTVVGSRHLPSCFEVSPGSRKGM